MSDHKIVDAEGKPYDPNATYWTLCYGKPLQLPTTDHGPMWSIRSKTEAVWLLWGPEPMEGRTSGHYWRLDRCYTSEQALLDATRTDT